VEFPDGHVQEYNANKIIEAIYDNVDENGVDELFFEAIVGHERTPEANQATGTYTTKGRRICVSWKDGTSSWHTLAEIKNSYPLQLAEYAIQHQLDKEAAFIWWIKPTVKHKKTFIKAAKRRFTKRSHKFGIKVPQTVEEALQKDKETKTTFWRDAIQKRDEEQ
jgi:GH15 family glucan-1,4-alpha-glucosidase